MGKRGPEPIGYDIELRVKVSVELDAAVAQLVQLTGVSKATVVRTALLAMLTTCGLVYPGVAEALVVTRPAGPHLERKHQ